MAATLAEIIEGLVVQVRDLRNGVGFPIFGRRSATDPTTVTASAAWAGTSPTMRVLVGPSGRLAVTVTGRLVASGGTAPRMRMGYALAGPYLNEAATQQIAGVTPTTIAPVDDRALTVVTGEITASLTYEHTALAPGWWTVTGQYLVTATAGTPVGTAAARQIIAAPL